MSDQNVTVSKEDQSVLRPEHQALAAFYNVGTLTALVDAQAKHIQRLQSLIHQIPEAGHVVYLRSPREG